MLECTARPGQRIVVALLTITLGLVCIPGPVSSASGTTTVTLWIDSAYMLVNHRALPIDAQGTHPILFRGRTLVPIRSVIEAFGGTTTWDPADHRVTITLGDTATVLWIGHAMATVNGLQRAIDPSDPAVVPTIIANRTMIPLRFVAESLGIVADYNPAARKITLTWTSERATALPDNDNLLLGNPSKAIHDSTASPDNYLMDTGYYTLSYSRSRATANWVSWHVGRDSIGSASRQDEFVADESLPPDWYRVQPSSFSRSGFERGHNCPSGDRTSSVAANASTFIMTNIIPQAPNNNHDTWEGLESYIRQQVQQGNEAYVIMGSYGIGGTGSSGYLRTVDNNRVTVPARIWKVAVILPEGNADLARITTSTTVLAIDTPNSNDVNPRWQTYLTSVDAIETATGYDLLSNVSPSIQQVLESRVDHD